MNTRSIGISLILIILFLFIIKLFDISYPLRVTVANTNQELAVVGEGKVEAIPDMVYVDVGITINNANDAMDAKKQVDTINNQLIIALKKIGMSPKDIKTTNYSIYPTYTYENNSNRINGYDGNATITVKSKKIETAPLIIEEATKAGANQINNTRFVIEDPSKYRNEAREKAIKNAKEQANKIAQSLGIRLGRIVNVVESLNGSLNNDEVFYATKMSGGGGPGMESGSETVTSTVTLYFEKR
jgi:hypothetical protein